uniref:Chromodomain-helicase-DNA-binding protein 7-like n=1 Tax=Saccoglossus kowalevskii TaxID=10224 RepID=A0ABM0GXF5_SACKO
LLKPMMLRRLKEDVEKNLAAKEETIIEVELTNIQKKYYRAILERNFSFLAKGSGSNANVPNLMNTMMELRKCCNHPFLINGAEEQIMLDFPENNYLRQLLALIQSAGKMVLIDKLLPKLKEGGHKVLIFSQMVKCLDILEDYLLQKRYPYERIDGRVRGNLRQAAIDRFSKPDSDRFVFLLCTRAGGLGINLTAADTVIIFDSDWNPQNDLQAQARCHRIGQSKLVKVYRLITRNSYEREMFDRASLKLGLDKAVLQSMRHQDKDSANAPTAMSKKEIEELLRKGAYGAIMDDDESSSKFCEEDIDQILQRRTQVVQIESEGKGSTFAKASFVSSSDRRDISLDDPDFWQKWAKKADVDTDEIKSRDIGIIHEPRRRKQTRRFGNLDEVLDFTSESDSEEEAKVSKKQLQTGWTRVECFRVEKGLLTYGWGRWADILKNGKFKRKLGEKDVEAVSRTILVFCLQYYKGDSKIKSFIWDLVKPPNEGSFKSYKNHAAAAHPVQKGKKGKKGKREIKVMPALLEYDFNSKNTNPEELLQDPGYKNHLKRHCNKVLLRVRMLYYLKQEVVGDLAVKISQGAHVNNLQIPAPIAEGDPPIGWWDDEADISLMVGVYKHGYEKYTLVRGDPALCFLDKCGPPDARAIRMEENDDDVDMTLDDDPEFKPIQKLMREDLEEDSLSPSSISTPQPSPRPTKSMHKKIEPPTAPGKLPFPAASDLNTRLRRLITSYQRNHKKQQVKQAQRARKEAERKHRFEEALKQKELKKKEQAQRWSRREESDFYRTVSAFGVEYDPETKIYKWDNFRRVARLDKKTNEKLQEYYENFRAMCLRVSSRNKHKEGEEDSMDLGEDYVNSLSVEQISEERSNKCMQRIELLLKVRNEIIPHPELDDRLQLCKSSMELPEWWEPGKHDKDMLLGVAKYGINRTESQHHMMNDPDLSFHLLKEKYSQAMIPSDPPASMATPYQTTTSNSQDVSVKQEEHALDLSVDSKFKEEIKTEPGSTFVGDDSKSVKKEAESCSVKVEKQSETEGDDDDDDDVGVKSEPEEKKEDTDDVKLEREMTLQRKILTSPF